MKTVANGTEIDYRDEGSGVPVILLHAFPLNQAMWDDQFRVLQQHCRTITLDLRGFGQSSCPQGTYSIDEMAADVRGLMSVLAIDRAVLVGLSMGGYIALAFYRNYPEAVQAMVLADTRASAENHESRERRLESAERAEREGASAIAEDMVPLLLGQTSLETSPGIAARVRSVIERNSRTGIANAQRAIAGRRDSTDMLAHITVPVFIVVGSEDKLIKVEEARQFRQQINGAQFRVIEGAGHLSSLERPDEFNAVIIELISSLGQIGED